MTIPNHQLCQIRVLCEVNGVVAVLRAISETMEDAENAMLIKACAGRIKEDGPDVA